MSFPKNFLWGGDISANQAEGGWNEGGKAPNMTDYMTGGTKSSPRMATYVMPDGTIKLGDFGIAQAEGLDDDFTKTSEIVGSVHYLAPEISQGKPASIQSDIYSAGVTFYELLTGHVPFDKDTPVNVAVAHIKEKFPPVKKYLPTCPKEIEKIIANATKKRLSERYKGADEFYQDLLEVSKDNHILKEKKPLLARIFGFK